MTNQQLEKGSTYRAEAEFTVDKPNNTEGSGLFTTITGQLLTTTAYDKIEKIGDQFEKGAYYLDPEIGRVYRRTGFDLRGEHPKWDEVGKSYVRAPDVVDEAKLVRIHREDGQLG